MTPCTVPGGGSAASSVTVVKSHAPESRNGINFCATCSPTDLDATGFLKSKMRRRSVLCIFLIQRQNVVMGHVLRTDRKRTGYTGSHFTCSPSGIGVRRRSEPKERT